MGTDKHGFNNKGTTEQRLTLNGYKLRRMETRSFCPHHRESGIDLGRVQKFSQALQKAIVRRIKSC